LQSLQKEDCRGEAGKIAPVVDRNRCEAKEDCLRVCPFDVFEIRTLSPEERASLSWLGWFKALAHKNRQAYAVRPQDCHGCQLCVAACPENALRLVAYRP